MLEQRILELINAEIDGELGPEEQSELDGVLESSEEARAMRTELRKLANLMDGMPEQAPPADLADRILEQVHLPSRKPASFLTGLLSSLQPAPIGVAFAAGLLVAVGFYEVTLGHKPALDPASIVGTMVANPQEQAAEVSDRLSIAAAGVAGTVSLGATGNFRVLNFDLESADPAEIEIVLPDAGLRFGGLARSAAKGDTADESYEVSGGTLRVVKQGHQAFQVFLLDTAGNGAGREISIGISSNGASVFSGVLRG
jgi:anti-sigma factor RsiW